MEALIVQLVDVVQKEVGALQRLLEFLEQVQQVLVQHDVERLGELVIEQQALVDETARLERQRAEVVDQLAPSLQDEAKSLTLKKLIDRLQGPHSDRLSEMRQTLIELHDRIQKANRNNGLLIKQSMKYVDKSLQILTGGANGGGVYVRSGKLEGRSSDLQGVVNRVV